jgi:hypothetical protein
MTTPPHTPHAGGFASASSSPPSWPATPNSASLPDLPTLAFESSLVPNYGGVMASGVTAHHTSSPVRKERTISPSSNRSSTSVSDVERNQPEKQDRTNDARRPSAPLPDTPFPEAPLPSEYSTQPHWRLLPGLLSRPEGFMFARGHFFTTQLSLLTPARGSCERGMLQGMFITYFSLYSVYIQSIFSLYSV